MEAQTLWIKALSLYQPWASLIGDKTIETRPRQFTYRGPLLICASLYGAYRGEQRTNVFQFIKIPLINEALSNLFNVTEYLKIYWKLPFGQAVAVCNLTACFSTNESDWMQGLNQEQIKRELAFGNFSNGRFALKLENIRRLEKPFYVRGHQGLFDVEVPVELI